MDVSVIGLGLIGTAVSQRLIRSKRRVWGYDVNPDANEAAAQLGVEVCDSAADAIAASSTVLLCLLTSDDRRRLFWGGQNGAKALRSGALVLDLSTSRPEDIEADHRRLGQQHVRLVDVSISGSSQAVAEGAAIALLGDTESSAASYIDIVRTFTKAQFFFDRPGQGNRAKLIVNTVFGLHRLVLAEALALARAGGFDLNEILDVLKQGDTYSRVMDTKGLKMIHGDYEPPAARLEQHRKDVGLILDYAGSVHAKTPVSELHRDLLDIALEKGFGPADNAAIFEAYSE